MELLMVDILQFKWVPLQVLQVLQQEMGHLMEILMLALIRLVARMEIHPVTSLKDIFPN